MLSAFEKLPAELRLRIYEELLPSGKYLVPCKSSENIWRYPAAPISAILATNRNIHADAGPYLYGNNIVDLDFTLEGHVGRPSSSWCRFGPNIQHIEISVPFLCDYYAVLCGDQLEIQELDILRRWEKGLMDGIANTGLKSLRMDMIGGLGVMKRMLAWVEMLQRLMKNVVVERLTMRWLERGGMLVSNSDWREETTESQDESRGDRTKSVVEHLYIGGYLDIMEVLAVRAVVDRRIC